MANSEDYLDGLLDSVKSVRGNVTKAEELAEENRRYRQEQRNKIQPDDDFMEASGLSDFTPQPTDHVNLRQAFSEEDFLKDFEEELENDSELDAFCRSFEEEMAQEELALQEEAEGSFMDNIESIVNQAKEQIEQGELPEGLSQDMDGLYDDAESADITENESEDFMANIAVGEDATEEDGIDELFMEEQPKEEASLEEISLDALSLGEEAVDETGFLDENDSSMDLMDLLSGDEQLEGLGDLLQAEESDIPLEEAQETFEQSAQEVQDMFDGLEGDSGKTTEKKESIFSKIKALFQKKDKGQEQTDVLDITEGEQEDLGKENLEILQSLDEADDSAEQKKKEKKEKKPKQKKEKKPKKVKEKREKKPKKEKQPDNSPKIPGKTIGVFVVLSVSIVILVTMGQSFVGYRLALSTARGAYENGNYFKAYEELMGVSLREEDEELFRKARLLGDLQKRNREYEVFIQKEMYPQVLDSLIIGVARYTKHAEEAKSLGIEEAYTVQGEQLIQLLQDQFGVTQEEAIALYHLGREEYSIRLDEILQETNLM